MLNQQKINQIKKGAWLYELRYGNGKVKEFPHAQMF